MTLSQALAEFAVRLRFEDIPPEVIANAKLRLLDTVGACLASVGMQYADVAAQVVNEQGASAESTLIGTPQRASPGWAAFYNGALAHGNDYDDTHSASLMHASAVVIPAVLAMGERSHASGADTLAAAMSAYETALRIGIAASGAFHARGFHTTSVCGVFAAAIAAAKLLRLDPGQTAHAIGIAGSQASGTLEVLTDGAWTKRMHPGWAAHGGIIAAQLAARGFTGAGAILEGKQGLFRTYAGMSAPDAATLTAGLGRIWEVVNIDVKPYPCGHISHPYMDCARELRSQHKLTPSDIASIELRVHPGMMPIVCEPLANKIRPATAYAACFSLPFAVAVVLARGHAGIDDFSEESIKDPQVLELAARMRYVVDDTLPFPKAFPGWVKIRLRDGREIERRMDFSRGSREHPMSAAELEEKFSANAVRCLPATSARAIWDAGMRLEQLSDIGQFTRLLVTQ